MSYCTRLCCPGGTFVGHADAEPGPSRHPDSGCLTCSGDFKVRPGLNGRRKLVPWFQLSSPPSSLYP
eukprot:5675642-Lingulodinium_polyedra.AAC.1